MAFKVKESVQWKWAGGVVEGVVEKVFIATVKMEIKGKVITRHGTPTKPAYLVRSLAGNLALKLESELSAPPATKSKATRRKRPDVGF